VLPNRYVNRRYDESALFANDVRRFKPNRTEGVAGFAVQTGEIRALWLFIHSQYDRRCVERFGAYYLTKPTVAVLANRCQRRFDIASEYYAVDFIEL
jgi:hypothetical protein